MEVKVVVGLDEETKRIAWEFLTNISMGGSTPKVELQPVDSKVKTDKKIASLESEVGRLQAQLEAQSKSQNELKPVKESKKEIKKVEPEVPTEPVEEVIESAAAKEQREQQEYDNATYETLVEVAKSNSKDAAKQGKREEIKILMNDMGFARISDIPADRIQEYIDGVEAIANV